MKILLAMLLFVLLSVHAAGVFAQTADVNNPPAALTEVPETVLYTELQRLGGRSFKLSDYSGKVIVLNFFATWCAPCVLESPALAELYKEFKDRGVVVIELSTEDPEASQKSTREWVWDFRLPYPVGWTTREFAATLMQERDAIPQTFVIGRDGRIVRRFIGFDSKKTSSQWREAVEEALTRENR
ncbi:MAG TPA: TlpA disulfide reductase family protein [Pyrinomonadaceae bacterium]